MQLGFCEQGQVVESKMKETDGQGTTASRQRKTEKNTVTIVLQFRRFSVFTGYAEKQQSSLETV